MTSKKDMSSNGLGESKASRSFSNSIFNLVKSFSVEAIAIGAIYMVGYYKISPFWLLGPLLVSILRSEWKTEKEVRQNIAMAAALKSDRKLVIEHFDHLPSWIYYPDVDRCDWLNSVVVRLWPYFNDYAMEVLINTVEPNINDSLSHIKKDGFKFLNVRVGSIPPRISGVKVYDKNVNRKEIVMDINISYAGDCDFTCVLFGLKGGIKNFQMCGLLRIVMKPLMKTLPLFGGLEIYFLNKPKIDFTLIGVADLLDMPGVSGILRTAIDNRVASLMVLPNKIPVKFSDDMKFEEFTFPDPDGVIRVNVIEAIDLPNKDSSMFGKGKSDPYVKVEYAGQLFKSTHVEDSLSPRWNFWAEFIVGGVYEESVLITVWDKDDLRGDDRMGSISIRSTVNFMKEKGLLDKWIVLEESPRGLVHLRMFYFNLSSNKNGYHLLPKEEHHLSSSILTVYIDSAHNLVNPRNSDNPDPFFNIVVGNRTQATSTVKSTKSPVFGECFIFLVNDPEYDNLRLQVFDKNTNIELGNLMIDLKQLLECENMEILDSSWPLVGSASESNVVLSLRLRILIGLNASSEDTSSHISELE